MFNSYFFSEYAPPDDIMEAMREEIYADADDIWAPGEQSRAAWIHEQFAQTVAEWLCDAMGTRAADWRRYLEEAHKVIRSFEAERKIVKVEQ